VFLPSDSDEEPISNWPPSHKEASDDVEQSLASPRQKAETINLCSDDESTDECKKIFSLNEQF